MRSASAAMDRFKVIIIGAGPAGVAAATRLVSRGVDKIVLLEAESRIGGRIHTVPFGNGVVDLGAQFCHGEKGNVVYEMAHPLDLLESSMPLYSNMCFVESSGQIVQKDIGAWLLGMCLDITDEAAHKLKNYPYSLGDFVTSEFNKRTKEEYAPQGVSEALKENFLDWFHRFENSIDGSDSWFETSGSGHTEYIECEGDPVLVWKNGGYRTVLDLLMKKYPNPSLALPIEPKILLDKVVSKITWDMQNGAPVSVDCDDGSEYHGDYVIVTVSLGVLKDKAEHLFTPSLPKKKLDAIKGLSIGVVNKIFLEFPYVWWPDTIHGFSLIWTKEDADDFMKKHINDEKKAWLREVFGFYKDLGQPGVLCAWIVGPEAKNMELRADQEVLDGCQELLEKFLGHQFLIPKIKSIVRSSWFSNPHFRGSYSFRSMKTEQMDVKAKHLAEPLTDSSQKKVLLFAGEATHEYFYSTVHGAIETGWREADRILQDIRGNKSFL